MSEIPLQYDILVSGQDFSLRIDWGNTPGWAERYEVQLAHASRLSLVPKQGCQMPVVTVDVTPPRRWVLFSRVMGQVNGPKRIRLYAIGWQATLGGVNVKVLTWVYPGGRVIECAEQPTHWRAFLDALSIHAGTEVSKPGPP